MKLISSSILLFASLCSVAPPAISCGLPSCKELDAKRLPERPWAVRYFIHVDQLQSLKIAKDVAGKNVRAIRQSGEAAVTLPYEHLFAPILAVQLPPVDRTDQDFGIVIVEFERNGRVTTENANGDMLLGEISDANYLVLKPTHPTESLPYHLADWFGGWSDPMRAFTPAFCGVDDDRRYRKGFKTSEFDRIGNFGCREWSFQLLDAKRPYIDVTSYERSGTFIKAFYGWAPFDGPRKPVIGKHRKTWVCLRDCPHGAGPGVIADIAKWCKENDFPIPKRPKKTPMFPNADFPYDYAE